MGCHWAAISGSRSASDCPALGALKSAARCRSAQARHPWPLARLYIPASQTFSHIGHCHQAVRRLRAATSSGFSGSLSSVCHSAARAGNTSANEPPGFGLALARPALRLPHSRQPAPLPRLWIMAFHSWPQVRQSHHARRLLEYVTISGVTSSLSVGCHSTAISGKRSANDRPDRGTLFDVFVFRATGCFEPRGSFRPRKARAAAARPQGGQPAPAARLPIDASQTFPHFAHSHHAFSFLEKATSAGVRFAFSVGCHSAAADGQRSASELPGLGIASALLAHFLQVAPCLRFATWIRHSFPQVRQSHQTFLLLA